MTDRDGGPRIDDHDDESELFHIGFTAFLVERELIIPGNTMVISPSTGYESEDGMLGIDSEPLLSSIVTPRLPNPRFTRERVEWIHHLDQLTRQSQDRFGRTYRMSISQFDRLVRILRPYIEVDAEMSIRSSSGISPIEAEIMTHCFVRWMAGASSVP